MSRRVLSLLLALGLLAGMLSGCGKETSASAPDSAAFGSETGPDAPAPSAAPDAEPTAKVLPTTGSFSMPCNDAFGWDPFACTGMENRAVMQLIYEGLFTMNNQFDAEPMLCSAYTVSDDGMVYTLELRDAKFSSGKELNADDVVYSMEKAALSDLYSGRFDDIAAYYPSGLTTVTIEMIRPNDRLPCLLTFPIIPAAVSTNAPVGTGPFVRNSTVLTLNSHWWQGPSTLNFQSVSLYSSASAEDTRDHFEIDNVHFVYNNPNAATAATYHCDYELWNSRGTVMQYIGFNFEYGVFQDREVRAAITHAIDRASIAESVYHNFADAAALPAAPSSSVYFEDLARRFSFTSSKAAMDELMSTASFYLPEELAHPGAAAEVSPSPSPDAEEDEEEEDDEDTGAETDGESPDDENVLTYNNITMLVMEGNLNREAAAKQVAQYLTDAGFTVTLKSYKRDEFIFNLNNTDWDIYYGEVMLQPDFDLRPLLLPGGSLNYGHFSGPTELFDLMDKAQENSGNRYDLYEFIMERGYLCPVLFINNAVFTTRGVFTGLNPSPDHLFYQISNIHVNHK